MAEPGKEGKRRHWNQGERVVPCRERAASGCDTAQRKVTVRHREILDSCARDTLPGRGDETDMKTRRDAEEPREQKNAEVGKNVEAELWTAQQGKGEKPKTLSLTPTRLLSRHHTTVLGTACKAFNAVSHKRRENRDEALRVARTDTPKDTQISTKKKTHRRFVLAESAASNVY